MIIKNAIRNTMFEGNVYIVGGIVRDFLLDRKLIK